MSASAMDSANKKSEVACGCCPDKLILNLGKAVKCVGCGAYYHNGCAVRLAKRNDGAFKKCCGGGSGSRSTSPSMQDKANVVMVADDVDDEDDDQIESFNELYKKMKGLFSKNFQDMNDKFDNSMSNMREDINNKLSDVHNRIDAQDERIDEISVKVDDCNNNITASISSMEDLILSECFEQRRREKNLIFHKVREAGTVDGDKDTIVNLLPVTPFDKDKITVFRIGSRGETDRPLKVCFNSADDVAWVMRNAHSFLKGDVKCCPDRTPRQREKLHTALEELNRRSAAGEEKLILKHQSGIPRIVISKN